MSSSNKRQRELARAKYERQQARVRAAEAKKKRRQQIIVWSVVGALVIGSAAGLLWAFALNQDDEAVVAAEPVAQCLPAGEPASDWPSFDEPGQVLKGGQRVRLTINTNCGPIVLATYPKKAPKTVNSQTFLAQQAYFDRTICHRLTTDGIFVLQCGDPTGTGGGDPGYSIPEENLPAIGPNNYPAGTVAMANAGPGTTGSQFFIVYEDSTLPGPTAESKTAGYTIWGEVLSGLDIVRAIAGAGVADGGSDGAPAQTVMIDSVDAKTS